MIEEDSGCVIPVSRIAAGISSLSSSKYAAENSLEYDNTPRKATVYLYTTPLKGWSQNTTDKFRHWGLVFEFICNAVRYVEGDDDNGLLMPFYHKERPMEDGKYFRLGEVETSPNVLRDITVKNGKNKTRYDVAKNNCQEWVRAYADLLNDENIISKLKNVATLREANPGFADVLSKKDQSWKSTSRYSKD